MRSVYVSDRTLCGHGGASFRRKIEVAGKLDAMGVSAVESPRLPSDESGAVLMRTLCGVVQSAVVALECDWSKEGVTKAWEAVKTARKPRLIISAPATVAQMEYVCHVKPAQACENVSRAVEFARSLCSDIEFRCDDATRADEGLMKELITRAVGAGATAVTVCDAAGLSAPDEIAALTRSVRAMIGDATLYVSCRDELGMARANALAALCAGADGVKTAIADSLPPPDAMSAILRARGADFKLSCCLDGTRARRLSLEIADSLASTHGANTPFDGLPSGASGDPALPETYDDARLFRACRDLGYTLGEEDLCHVRESLEAESRGKAIGRRELEAIILSVAQQVPRTYRLVNFVINSGSAIAPTASVALEKDGEELRGLCTGDGPIDAAFLAIEQIIGRHYELDDFQIAAVTQNRGAMGDALVRLRHKGRIYAGKGISTDIIGAAIRAYLNALNKIAYEEKQS